MMAPAGTGEPQRRAVVSRGCTVAGSLAAEAVAGYWHPKLGAALAAADVIIPAVIALVLLTAILGGSTETCERAFRLLRWIAGRPEPPAPPASGPAGDTSPASGMPGSRTPAGVHRHADP